MFSAPLAFSGASPALARSWLVSAMASLEVDAGGGVAAGLSVAVAAGSGSVAARRWRRPAAAGAGRGARGRRRRRGLGGGRCRGRRRYRLGELDLLAVHGRRETRLGGTGCGRVDQHRRGGDRQPGCRRRRRAVDRRGRLRLGCGGGSGDRGLRCRRPTAGLDDGDIGRLRRCGDDPSAHWLTTQRDERGRDDEPYTVVERFADMSWCPSCCRNRSVVKSPLSPWLSQMRRHSNAPVGSHDVERHFLPHSTRHRRVIRSSTPHGSGRWRRSPTRRARRRALHSNGCGRGDC